MRSSSNGTLKNRVHKRQMFVVPRRVSSSSSRQFRAGWQPTKPGIASLKSDLNGNAARYCVTLRYKSRAFNSNEKHHLSIIGWLALFLFATSKELREQLKDEKLKVWKMQTVCCCCQKRNFSPRPPTETAANLGGVFPVLRTDVLCRAFQSDLICKASSV